MDVKLIDVMGDDLRVVNAARVSFDKESDWEWEEYDLPEEADKPYALSKSLSDKDVKLINYLAKHNHWTPFSHVQITMREKVPIFVARQRFKHMVGFTYNEVSRRYVDSPPEFFIPSIWRGAPEGNKKQGSSEKEIKFLTGFLWYGGHEAIKSSYSVHLNNCMELYDVMIENGVAPEQARMILPQSMYTEYYVTGSLAAWARAYKLRIDEHAQKEIRDLAVMWNTEISKLELLKHSWSALTNGT